MKVIFLDIDGVLNYNGSSFLSEDKIVLLRDILRRTGAKLVLSSSWRIIFYKPEIVCKEVELIKSLFIGDLELYGYLPFEDIDRSKSIEIWLKEHSEIEKFVIVDDWDINFMKNFPNQFVRTSGFWKKGLTKENCDAIIEKLR